MWSLYTKKESEDFLQDFSGEKLEPLKFSNGKTQADVVREILDAINSGSRIIFIKGVCGTGKSAIALNLARHFKKTSVVVPIKSLQEQYEQDYTHRKYILKKDGKKMKIAVVKGRSNFPCLFSGGKADSADLPCTIEIKEKNLEKIKKYIEMNQNVNAKDFSSIHDVRRMSVAPACEFWCPLMPAEKTGGRSRKYMSVSGKEYSIYNGKKGCRYYNQYDSYFDADVLIFNSLKYTIEVAMGRKPQTDLDIIDECDEFLDSFAQEKSINLNRLHSSLSSLPAGNQEQRDSIKKLLKKINDLIYDFSLEGVEKLDKTPVLELVELILDNSGLAEEEEENYFNAAYEIASEFSALLSETYVSFEKRSDEYQKTLFGAEKKETAYVNLVTINLKKKFSELVDKTQALVLMSGTLHSEKVLKDMFGIKDFKIIEAETSFPGTISKFRTGLEKNCKYENFKSGAVSRKDYLKALSACVDSAKKPVLVHVNSFEDMPSEKEKHEYQLNNLISKEKLKEIQSISDVEKFKSGEIDLLFTTKCSRGVDFPGEQCNSIIMTRYPYPNIQSAFWQILRKERPEEFTEFYMDKAKRELLQKIYRGLRFKGDFVILLSPDIRVLNDSLK